MAQVTINNGDTGLVARTAINDNFTEVYADAATAQAAADAAQATADAALDTRTNSQASTASLALNVDTHDVGQLTAQAEALILANPTGTPVDNNGIIFKIKDDATPRAITFGSEFRAMGVALPTTTVASKWMYIVAVRNSTDTKWDVVSVNEEA